MANPDRGRLMGLASWLPILLLLAGFRIFPFPAMESHEGELPRIEPDSLFERSISGGESHRYRVHLPAGQSLRVIVEQKGIDLMLAFFDSAGSLIRDYDGPTFDRGNEYGILVSESGGEFTLEVQTTFDASPPGDYRLVVDYLGPASERDRHLHRGLLLDFQTRGLEPRALVHRQRLLALRRRALDHYRAAGHARAISYSRFQLAQQLNWLGEQEQALDQLRQLLGEIPELSRSGALRVDETWAHLEWLDATKLSGDLHQAIGSIYFDHGVPERALGYFETAAEIGEVGSRWRIESTQGIGVTHREMGNPERAFPLLEEVFDYWQVEGHAQRVAIVLREIGLAHEASGRFSAALEAHERSLELTRSHAIQTIEIVQGLADVGRMQLAVGNRPAALECYREALRHLRSRRFDASSVLFAIAEIHRSAGRGKAASELYRQALADARDNGNAKVEKEILHGLAEWHRAEGRLDEALEAIRLAMAIAEAEHGSTPNPHMANPLLASSQPVYDLQVELLMALHSRDPQAGHAIEAFETSERSRARGLLDTLPRSYVSASTESAWLQERLEIEQRLEAMAAEQSHAFGGRLPSRDEAPAEHSLHLDLLNRHAEVEAKIRSQRVRDQPGARAEPSSLRQIRRHVLDAETLLVEYDLGERSSWLFALTQDRLISRELPSRAEIETVARQLYEGVTARSEHRNFETGAAWQRRIDRADVEAREAADRLSRLLLEPLAELLDRQRLVIVADGLLQSIPFAILPRPGGSGSDPGSGEPMIVRHEIVGAPSASVLASLRTDRPTRLPATRTLAILADPVFGRNDSRLSAAASPGADPLGSSIPDPGALDAAAVSILSPEILPDHGRLRDLLRFSGQSASEILGRLPATGQEAHRIAERLSPEEVLVALGLEASRELALEGELASARIVHFASHAVMASDYPELSGIVLSQFDAAGRRVNGFLSMADIRRLELSADLVVLSACRTALGKDVRGEGLLGLHRGFMRAGAPAVLASVWSPRDRATAELMDRFYENLLEGGHGPAAALRHAQISMWRDQYPAYHWGGFVFQGDWRMLASRESTAR